MNDQPPTNTSGPNQPTTGPNLWHWRLRWLILLFAIALALALAAATTTRHHTTKAITGPFPQVSVTKSGFFPKLINIKAGQSVTWTSYDANPHWIASDPYPKDDKWPSLNSSGPLANNDSYSFTFDSPGTYTYHDDLHPYALQGTVVVR